MPIFCRRQYFVDANNFVNAYIFVNANNFVDAYIFVGANILSPPVI
jgi:hypothetical protein